MGTSGSIKTGKIGERRSFRGKVKNAFWTCQKYLLSGPFQKLFADPWHKQCSQGKKVASKIYEYGCNLLKIEAFIIKYFSLLNTFGSLCYRTV